jgi:putative Holliday junction resolvase
MSRILGIDYGEKRIGLALTDASNSMASPLKAVPNDESLVKNLQDIIKEYNVEKIIIGIPVNLKGEHGYEAGIVLRFVENIIEPFGIPVLKIDERFTSRISADLLSGNRRYNSVKKKRNLADAKRIRKSGNIDKISAAVILNDYLALEEIKKMSNGFKEK